MSPSYGIIAIARSLFNSKKSSDSVVERKGTATRSPEGPSALLQLPPELRIQIYICLFASTTFSFSRLGINHPRPWARKKIKPDNGALAILRTCRQIRDELSRLWPRLVVFDFEGPEAILDRMPWWPESIIPEIRHVRVLECCAPFLPRDHEYSIFYALVRVFQLIPYLRLDTVTILATSDDEGGISYNTLDQFVRRGNGWRELRFIVPNSTMLGFSRRVARSPMNRARREPQPSHWEKTLLQRDGADSGSSVTIYRSSEPVASVANLDTASYTWQVFEQAVPPDPEDLENFDMQEDVQLMGGDERRKPLLVVVRRGEGVADIADFGEQQGLEDANGLYYEMRSRGVYTYPLYTE